MTPTTPLPLELPMPTVLSGLPGAALALVAALLTLVACSLVLRPRGRGLHRLTTATDRRSSSPATTFVPSTRATGSRRLTNHWPLLPAAAFLTILFGPQLLVSTIAIAVVVFLIATQRAEHQRRTSATSRRAQIIEALDVLAADLSAGRPPIDALEGAATISPDLRIAHAAATLGADIPAALDRAAGSPGANGLRALAAAWRVSEESGAAFATLTERLATALRADEAIHRQTEASLAGARSTARILATLPAFGIALGYSLGAKPLTFLTATPSGWICLALGLGLTTAGLHWTTHLAKIN